MPPIRGGDLVEGLRAESAAHESGETFVLIAGAPGNERFNAHAQLSGPGDEVRAQERDHHGGRHQHHAFGDGMKAMAVPDVSGRLLAGAGADELLVQAEPRAEMHGRRLLGDEGVGTAFDEEAILEGGGDLPAPVRRTLDQGEVGQAALAQVVRGCQSCDAAADDDCFAHGANTSPTKVVPLQDSTATCCKVPQGDWGVLYAGSRLWVGSRGAQ